MPTAQLIREKSLVDTLDHRGVIIDYQYLHTASVRSAIKTDVFSAELTIYEFQDRSLLIVNGFDVRTYTRD